MRRVLQAIRDIWCAVSRRCRVQPPRHDVTLRWIVDQGADAEAQAAQIRGRRHEIDNIVEAAYLRRWRDLGGADG